MWCCNLSVNGFSRNSLPFAVVFIYCGSLVLFYSELGKLCEDLITLDTTSNALLFSTVTWGIKEEG